MPTPTQDPFAAIAQPARASSPPPAAPAQDPFAAIAQPAAATPPAAPSSGDDGGGLGGWVDRNVSNPDGPDADQGAWGIARGGIKSVGSGLGGLIDILRPNDAKVYGTFARDYKTLHPQASDDEVKAAYPESLRARMTGHIKDAADWLRTGSEPHGFWEHVGAIGEQTLELLGTDGLLKMAGGGVRAAELASKAGGVGEDLKAAQQVAATLKSNPKLAGLVSIGLKAVKDGLGLGAQTYVHTEDPQQAAIAGAGGALLSGATGLAGRYIQKIAPKNLEIAGEKMPALASQVNEAGEPIDTGARGAPAIAQAQQQGAAAATRNVAQQATAQAIDRINQTRPEVAGAMQDPSRRFRASGYRGVCDRDAHRCREAGR
jgi:hypothetical protein